MKVTLVGGQAETAQPANSNGSGPVYALRIWLIAPEHLPLGRVSPMLTGLYGYPWRTGLLDAKCTVAEGFDPDFSLPPQTERHHPVVPAPDCSCGIYAVRDTTSSRVTWRTPVGVPFVTGFVELTGRILAGRTTYRAGRAAIVGPLTIQPGRPPGAARLLRRSLEPQRVSVVNGAYRVGWSARPTRYPWEDWAVDTVRELRNRYEVEILR